MGTVLSLLIGSDCCSQLPLRKHFPNCTPLALDLLEKMLVFNPEKRITVDVSALGLDSPLRLLLKIEL